MKYITEIMPEIRKTGKYIIDSTNKVKLDKINAELENIKKDNKQLFNNQRNVNYPIDKAIYIIITIINDKKYYKVGFTKNLNKRLHVYNTGNPYKILFNYYLLVNDENIDNCMKYIMKNDELYKNKEYYVSSLNKILKFLQKCDSNLDNIFCGYCQKCYNFNDIKLHKCKYLS